jgi:Zn-dependent peptidase ImmA (M78 family)
MEEVAHVFLGHQPNRLAIINEDPKAGGKKGRSKQTLARDYNHDHEEAAYSVGAAALIPYAALRRLVRIGRRADQIARHFRVSRQLVEYRIKVTRLWPEYKGASASRPEHV